MARSILWANDFPPVTSGITTFFVNIWKNLPSDRVLVIAPTVPGGDAVDDELPFPVRRVKLPVGESGPAKAIKTLLTIVYCFLLGLFQRPSRNHCGQVFSSGIVGCLCSKVLGIPYIVYVYGSETVRLGTGGLASWLMRRVLIDCELVVANSEYTTDEFVNYGIPRDHIRVILPRRRLILISPKATD